MAPVELKLINYKNEYCEGYVRPFERSKDVLSWFVDWMPQMFDLAGNKVYSDSHWKVPEIWELFYNKTDSQVYIIESGGKIQGYICVELKHECYNSKKGVYIPFLATAPWNRTSTHNVYREFNGIGKIILSIAILKSYKELDEGRIELHSLKDAEDFYHKMGMMETGRVNERMKEFYMGNKACSKLIRMTSSYFKIGPAK